MNEVAPLSWRVLVDEPLPGPTNMARDHALAALVRPGTGTLRLYRWRPATLSLGRNEPAATGYGELLRRHPDMGVVRRPTGGRAVIHDRELTYSVVMPARGCGGARAGYHRINGALVAGLQRLGVDAGHANGRALPPDAGPCFAEATEGEVVVGGRKLAGSAQARIGGGLLQHGSLLLVADQAALMADGHAGRRSPRPATLAEVLREVPPWERLVAAFSSGFEQVFGGNWSRGRMTEIETGLAEKLEMRYGSRGWTWRR